MDKTLVQYLRKCQWMFFLSLDYILETISPRWIGCIWFVQILKTYILKCSVLMINHFSCLSRAAIVLSLNITEICNIMFLWSMTCLIILFLNNSNRIFHTISSGRIFTLHSRVIVDILFCNRLPHIFMVQMDMYC